MDFGRKAILSLFAILIGVALVFLKGDIPPGFSSFLQWVLGSFIAGNVVAGATAGFAEALDGKSKAHVEATRIQADVAKAQLASNNGAPQQVDLGPVLEQQAKLLEAVSIVQSGLIKTIEIVSKR